MAKVKKTEDPFDHSVIEKMYGKSFSEILKKSMEDMIETEMKIPTATGPASVPKVELDSDTYLSKILGKSKSKKGTPKKIKATATAKWLKTRLNCTPSERFTSIQKEIFAQYYITGHLLDGIINTASEDLSRAREMLFADVDVMYEDGLISDTADEEEMQDLFDFLFSIERK